MENTTNHGAASPSPSPLPRSLARNTCVRHLLYDMKVLTAYKAAADWQEDAVMERAFNNFSWSDPDVLSSLPEYLNAPAETKKRIDYAFNALFPTPSDPCDTKVTLISTWIKARLFSYDKNFPFEFNPYRRG
ncbi:hypothetical protein IE077_004467 [Cardiosporidium cionae]|uniref:ATPTG10-like domain-containing protein n=1 Tax=Cardiosporidium cionae TaxID=476202 RepID=A0ABQ7JGI4_9APIC|nr:hypothetical protein IE077_004467 [Cardiosporidium cionae]|eukprot:KAF8823132.1 hypothetical protein IE077_004467 [Cardiosporidium cionae]